MFTPMNELLLSVIIIVLVHKLHSLGIGKLPDPILRAWYYAIAEAENRVWPRETMYSIATILCVSVPCYMTPCG